MLVSSVGCCCWRNAPGGAPDLRSDIHVFLFVAHSYPAAGRPRFCQYCSQSGKYFILVCSRTGPVPEKAEAIVVDVVTVLYLLTGGRAGLCWVPELSEKRVVVDFRLSLVFCIFVVNENMGHGHGRIWT